MAKYQPKTKEELKALCDDLSVNLGDIDTSLITDMSYLFHKTKRGSEHFSGIEKWDTSNVKSMEYMFYEACFNSPIEAWSVKKVETMQAMFCKSTFNQPLNKWETDSLTDIAGIFEENKHFNFPLNGWNTSNVTNMNCAFSGSIFNQDIASWDTSSVTSMDYMFRDSLFNKPLENWNVEKVESMRSMFEHSVFNHPLENWNVCNLKDASSMFAFSVFSHPLNGWKVKKGIDVRGMFYGTSYQHDVTFLFGLAQSKFSDFMSHENKYVTRLLQGIVDELDPFGKYELCFSDALSYHLRDTDYNGTSQIFFCKIISDPEKAVRDAFCLAHSLEESFKETFLEECSLKNNVRDFCLRVNDIKESYAYYRMRDMCEFLKAYGVKIRGNKLNGELLNKILVEKIIHVGDHCYTILRRLVLEKMKENGKIAS